MCESDFEDRMDEYNYESEELFDSPDAYDSDRSRSPRSPQIHESPPASGPSRRLTFSEPRRSLSSAIVTPESQRSTTGQIHHGVNSAGHKVNCPLARNHINTPTFYRGRNRAGLTLGGHRDKQPQREEGSVSRNVKENDQSVVSPTSLKENQPPVDRSSTDPGDSVAQQVEMEKEPQLSNESVLTAILSEVQKTNTRLESFEQRLHKLEESVQSPSSSSSSSATDKYKRTVPTRVRGLVREVYKSLLEDKDDFDGFDLKKRYTDPENQSVVRTLVLETKGQDCTIPTIQVQDAARTFFQSKLQQESLKTKGKYLDKVTYQRRRNRLSKKLEERKAALERTPANEAKKAKWKEILVSGFMSSEESGVEETEDGRSRTVFYVKPLPWRHPQVTKFLRQMDSCIDRRKSRRSSDKMLPRYPGQASKRVKPHQFPSDFWAFKQ